MFNCKTLIKKQKTSEFHLKFLNSHKKAKNFRISSEVFLLFNYMTVHFFNTIFITFYYIA